MAEQAALEAIGMWKRYGDRHAVRGVDLVVRAGEVHGLLGPNGAGKTTLMRMVLGLVRPDAGTVRLLGQAAGSTSRALPSGVAGFADTPQFYPYLSGRRNLRLLAGLDGTAPGSRAADKIDEVLAQVGLTAHGDVRVGGYSAGMRQRLGLAAALLRSPRLLVLDEPTSALDPAGARDLRAHLRRLARGGAAVLLSSHDMAEVEDLCAALTIVHQGRVAFSGAIADLEKQAEGAVHRLCTSDDERATSLGLTQPDLKITTAPDSDGIDVFAGGASLDAYVIALGRAGIAVRSLERRDRSLESLFLRLTAESADDSAEPSAPRALESGTLRVDAIGAVARVGAIGAVARVGAIGAVAHVECAKLIAQPTAWAVLGVCLAGPFAFVVAMQVQSSVPEDTLFGRWVKVSGFAVPLVVLGFAASWAFPVLTSVVAGDLFSSEDRYGTWATLLTRSRDRGDVFAGKVLAATAFSLLAVSVLAVSSIVAGLLVVGQAPLLSLSGTELPAGRSLVLVAWAWASGLPPVFGFTALAALLSAATRSSAAGVGLPVLIGFGMQLYSLVNGPEVVRRVLLTSPFLSWHGLFTEPRFYGPLVHGAETSMVYFAGCLAGAYMMLRGRDMG